VRLGRADAVSKRSYRTRPGQEILARERESANPNLHSARDVIGHYVQAADDDVGHVEDFLVDDPTWAIHMAIDTRNWLPGRKVAISRSWIKSVSWGDSKVYVELRRHQIEAAPEFDADVPMERTHETRLYEHYRRAKCWDEERERR
jgi:hypothetical protein